MSNNPTPHGLGPEEDGRVAEFAYSRFDREDGDPSFAELPPSHRKSRRRAVREIVDALQACGYRLVLEAPTARD